MSDLYEGIQEKVTSSLRLLKEVLGVSVKGDEMSDHYKIVDPDLDAAKVPTCTDAGTSVVAEKIMAEIDKFPTLRVHPSDDFEFIDVFDSTGSFQQEYYIGPIARIFPSHGCARIKRDMYRFNASDDHSIKDVVKKIEYDRDILTRSRELYEKQADEAASAPKQKWLLCIKETRRRRLPEGETKNAEIDYPLEMYLRHQKECSNLVGSWNYNVVVLNAMRMD